MFRYSNKLNESCGRSSVANMLALAIANGGVIKHCSYIMVEYVQSN